MSASPLSVELRGIPNPFRSGITRDAWDPDWVDVPQIHAGVSTAICEEVEAIRREGGSRGVIVYGEPGSGKTHLLNRIRRWCLQQGALFSGFRLQCAPQTLWRHLRREFAGDLLHPLPDGARQLDRLLAAGGLEGRGCGLYSLATVLCHWREGRFQRECEAWLRGDPLPDSLLEAMGIAAAGDQEEEAEDEARRVLKELLALASPVPVVLALDQVEAMQSDSQDPRGLRALGSAVAALRDESRNLVVVTCMQTSFIPVVEAVLHKADLDRMGERRLELLQLELPDARLLLIARLDAEPALRERRQRQPDPLWPFADYAVRQLLVPGGRVTARKLIYAARDLFEQLRHDGQAWPKRDAGRFLEAELRQRIDQVLQRSRWDGNEFLLDAMRRLMPQMGWRSLQAPPGVDLALEKEGRRLLLTMFNQEVMRGTPQRLRKLARLEGLEQLRLIRARELPISRTAVKTAQLLEQLERAGARLVRAPKEVLAALEACRTLLADAAAGDLHAEGETLGREFVESWLRGHLPEEAQQWLAGLESAGQAGAGQSAMVDALIECVRQEKVIAVEEAARRLGCTAQEVARYADQAQDAVAAVGRPPQVFYERCGG